MRSLAFTGLGVGFILMGVGLFALTLRKPAKSTPATPNKSQLRDQAALAEETKKMKIAAGITISFGVVLILVNFL